MIKILHSADWHLDSAFQGRTPEQAGLLRKELLAIPGKIAALSRQENCDLCLLAGDLFDGAYTAQSYRVLYDALESMEIPVFIAPGNHDYVNLNGPWFRESWPENVHIFSRHQVESVGIPDLSCRIYGAGFTGMDCPSLLEGFRADCEETYAIGVFHGDPVQRNAPYNPVTGRQVADSGLSYLALGHVHKADAFRAGSTLCAWPGCPMGRGYDEQGQKGVYIVTLEETAQFRFVPLDSPCFYDLEVAGEEPDRALETLLPPVGNEDFYRITFTGSCEAPDLMALQKKYPEFPNLVLRDHTRPPVDLWGNAGADTFEGLYFAMLKQAVDAGNENALLAAKLSRRILSGEEVALP